MRTSDFDYQLPSELIAQTPLEPRDASRLLVMHRATGRIDHRSFRDILQYLRPGDVMALNQSRVIPARMFGRRVDTGGKVELLLLRRESPNIWQALAQPGRRLRPGTKIIVEPRRNPSIPADKSDELPHPPLCNDPHHPPLYKGGTKWGFHVEILASHDDGIKTVRLESEAAIGLLGEMPLPPYIHSRLEDPERYQTIYSRVLGSAASPTAGLHFTEQLMSNLKDAGVELVFVTLHVGLDTFRPVQGEDPAAHKIHTEYFELDAHAVGVLNRARDKGRRVIAVGTTSVRVLEQAAWLTLRQGSNQLTPLAGQADLFILPGHQFRMVDALITNFHLPRSTLLMLVSAFAGRELVLEAYQEAIGRRYRFYSFGDAMLIL